MIRVIADDVFNRLVSQGCLAARIRAADNELTILIGEPALNAAEVFRQR
jgi:hypothetical protein